ncbi:hypothetical protein CaldiYA01_06310 [Caldicellulosiruptor diazotrophicus]|uniref:Uncharacterized protein n=1 Tax=Caldicellulosiruptor diazotrophicus TaxID=2806205 RepID=A0ABM7NKP0_9FIRM|nr:hypothetical protein CaldiYA01_06310 [Caldicellulosiruptor diazotrophicus]
MITRIVYKKGDLDGTQDAQVLTYADYLGFHEDARVMLIDGIIYNISPASSTIHQTKQ